MSDNIAKRSTSCGLVNKHKLDFKYAKKSAAVCKSYTYVNVDVNRLVSEELARMFFPSHTHLQQCLALFLGAYQGVNYFLKYLNCVFSRHCDRGKLRSRGGVPILCRTEMGETRGCGRTLREDEGQSRGEVVKQRERKKINDERETQEETECHQWES